MKKLLLLFVLFVNLAFSQEAGFEKQYADDYLKAVKKLQTFSPQLDSVTKKLKVPQKEVISVVFPEMVRYSIYSDAAQMAMLELFYVERGTKYANFSVGAFQIKPSFVEELEKEVSQNNQLTKKYAHILFSDTISAKKARETRLQRLKNICYQLVYACCFYEIMTLKYKNRTFKDKEEQLRLFATAYNSGMNMSYESLIKMQKVKLFPEGKICFNCTNYNYSEIVVEFYKKLSNTKKI
ncbi:MAG: hypothetical protein Q8M29_16975 [Bacteroidota bacterium]|nr:hypothetical protein [Bacteroidota bacterium]